MTVADIRAWVDEIREKAGDDEAAHAAEDSLHQAVLKYIRDDGPYNADQLAAEALRTLEIEFERWCA